jgi:hypothetical protein
MPKHLNHRPQGTLDLVILKTLTSVGPLHGYAIAWRIRLATDDSLRIEGGSLYPSCPPADDRTFALRRVSYGQMAARQLGHDRHWAQGAVLHRHGRPPTQLRQEERLRTLLTEAVAKALRFA